MRKLTALLSGLVITTLLLGTIAAAWTPPGQRGYEGQPGNQGWQHSN